MMLMPLLRSLVELIVDKAEQAGLAAENDSGIIVPPVFGSTATLNRHNV